MGWRVIDRREVGKAATPAVAATKRMPAAHAAVAEPAPVASVVTLPPPPPAPEAPRLDLGALALAPVAPVAPIAPSAPAAPAEPVAWYPRFERGDSLDGVLEATTPLLARAFGNVRAI
jgi:hypothetical protein